MNTLTPEIVAGGIRELTPLRASAVRLGELLGREPVTRSELLLLVSEDVALSSNLLPIANATYARGREPLRALHKAVARIGVSGVYRAALGLSLRALVPARVPGYGFSGELFIRHAAACAVLADALAGDLAEEDRDAIFTAALLHDVGKLVVGPLLTAACLEPFERTGGAAGPAETIEREILGLDHCAAGEQVLAAWDLPRAARLAVRWHHEPGAAPDSRARRLGSLVRCADELAHVAGFGTGLGGLWRHRDRSAELAIEPVHRKVLVASTFDAIQALALALTAAHL